jgi:glycosyltransferase involved in cell wall biosynthesis
VRTLVLIPAYNEEGHIGEVVQKVKTLGHECLVINDGSRDRTAQVAAEAGAEVVSNRHNMGLGPTIRRGYQEALNRGADIIVQLDADGQYDPAEIPKLTKHIKSNQADMVLGARLANLHYKMPFTKRVGNKAFSWVLRQLTGADVYDGQTGFRAMHREVLEKCLPINEFSYTQEMIIRAAKEGFIVKSVETNFYPRYDGKSRLFNNPFQFAFRAGWIITRTWRDYHPFKFFVWPGILFLIVSATFGFIVLQHFLTRHVIDGRLGSLVAAGVFFLFGVQLIFIGLLADMIRTHTKY